jgi:hypothetical protein
MRFGVAVLLSVVGASDCLGAESPYNLGVDAYKARNYAEAATQWSASVARGNTDAMNNLGYLLYNGFGVKKDLVAALDLWRAAAFAGHSEAQWHLGNAYKSGIGVEHDRSKAFAWYSCAIESASNRIKTKSDIETEADIRNDAKESLSSLTEVLTPNELDRGKALAIEYITRYGKPAP